MRSQMFNTLAVLALLLILAGLQKFGLLSAVMDWLKAATVAAIVPHQ